MKKILILAMMAALVIAAAASAEDYDFSGKTTAELVEIQQKVNEALWKSDGWNEVTVPGGDYEIGKEIPAGEWSIRPASDSWAYYRIYKGERNTASYDLLDSGSIEEPIKIILREGQWFQVASGPIIFTTYVPSFTFK